MIITATIFIVILITTVAALFKSGTISSIRPYSSTFVQTLKPVIKAVFLIATIAILSIVIISSKGAFMKTEVDCKPMNFVAVKNLQDYMKFEETFVLKDRFQEVPTGDFTVTTTDATEGDFIVASSEDGVIACMLGTDSHYKLRNRSKIYVEVYKDADGNFHYIPSTKEVYNLYKEGKYSSAKNYMQQIRTTYLLGIKTEHAIVPYLYKNDESLKAPFILR